MSGFRTPKPGGTERLSEPRVAGRAAFARVLREVVEEAYARGSALIPEICADLGVTETAVRNWADPTRIRAPLACGDLAALRPPTRLLILDRWTAHLARRLAHEAGAPGAAPSRHPFVEVVAVALRLGKAAEAAQSAIIDGQVDAPDWLRVAKAFDAIEAEARRARLACQFAHHEEVRRRGAR